MAGCRLGLGTHSFELLKFKRRESISDTIHIAGYEGSSQNEVIMKTCPN